MMIVPWRLFEVVMGQETDLSRHLMHTMSIWETAAMYVWELIAQRLRSDGWSVWHRTHKVEAEPTFTVIIHRPGAEWRANGPTLTEAFAAAARKARTATVKTTPEGTPHFALASASSSPTAA
jgi:hypothetical protein